MWTKPATVHRQGHNLRFMASLFGGQVVQTIVLDSYPMAPREVVDAFVAECRGLSRAELELLPAGEIPLS